MTWLKTTGKLSYVDERALTDGKAFKKTWKSRTLIANLPRHCHLDQYYIWLLTRRFGPWAELTRPLFGLHVTIIRGDERFDQRYEELWGRWAGTKIDIEYNPIPQLNWRFWSLEARSNEFGELRERFGLNPVINFHITVARANTSIMMSKNARKRDPEMVIRELLKQIPGGRGGRYDFRKDLERTASEIKLGFLRGTQAWDRIIEIVFAHLPKPQADWEAQVVAYINMVPVHQVMEKAA